MRHNASCFSIPVCQQDSPHQGQAGQEAEAEPTDPSVDPDEDRQHDPLQRQAPPLEEDQAQALRFSIFDFVSTSFASAAKCVK